MAQPDYVPVAPADRVRQTERLPPARPWTTSRPGEIRGLRPPAGESFGSPGPDQGYALRLAAHLEPRVVLAGDERLEDAVAGCVAVALKRASLFGRAPVVYDLELAFSLFGFLDDTAPAAAELIEYRRPLFSAAAHDYWELREIADVVPESTLRMTPSAVGDAVRGGGWRSLLVSDEEGDAGE